MKILLPTAGEEAAAEIADYVIAVARRLDAELLVLHILRDDESKEDGKRCGQVFTEAAHDTGVSVASRVVSGKVVESILSVANQEKVDMVLMGASKGNVVEKWLSADVMDECEMPVLVIPHCYRR